MNIQRKNKDKRKKMSMLIGRNKNVLIKLIHPTMSTLQETVYNNDSVLFNLH